MLRLVRCCEGGCRRISDRRFVKDLAVQGYLSEVWVLASPRWLSDCYRDQTLESDAALEDPTRYNISALSMQMHSGFTTANPRDIRNE